MSLETWKEEFYPADASDVPVEQAIQHSLRKWIGLRSENLDKHETAVYGNILVDEHDNLLPITDHSCSLCFHYMHKNWRCTACPLFVFLGRPCDDGLDSPYSLFIFDGNPEPMIEALQAIELL